VRSEVMSSKQLCISMDEREWFRQAGMIQHLDEWTERWKKINAYNKKSEDINRKEDFEPIDGQGTSKQLNEEDFEPIDGQGTSKQLNSFLDDIAIHNSPLDNVVFLRQLLSDTCTPLLLSILLQVDIERYCGLLCNKNVRNFTLYDTILQALGNVHFKTGFNPDQLYSFMLRLKNDGNFPYGGAGMSTYRPTWLNGGREEMQYHFWTKNYFQNYHLNPEIESKTFVAKVKNIIEHSTY
jgi:hypothetical protein